MPQYYSLIASHTFIFPPADDLNLEDSSVEYHCGWGKCNRDWCNCKAFEGNDDLCQNCGHPYSEHYGY